MGWNSWISHIVEIIEAFDIFDKNGDGVIAGKEVGPILRILGQNPTEAEINKFVSSADLEGKHKNVLTWVDRIFVLYPSNMVLLLSSKIQ
jgi:hypothetical protein